MIKVDKIVKKFKTFLPSKTGHSLRQHSNEESCR